jgi:hypothetical protein
LLIATTPHRSSWSSGSTQVGSKLVASITQSLETKAKRTAAEEELLRNLRESDDAASARVDTFLKACSERATKDPDAFALDMAKLLSAQRNAVRKLPIAEANELFPFDELNVPPTVKLNVAKCTLE